MCPAQVRLASNPARKNITTCTVISNFLRLTRSDIAPAIGVINKNGMSDKKPIVPVAAGVRTVSILTTGDTVANTAGNKPGGETSSQSPTREPVRR